MSGPALVTGGRGFLGSALAAELRRRGGTPALASRERGRGLISCDLLDDAAVRRTVRTLRPCVVFHLAGTHRPLGFEALWDAHVRSTVNLLEALRAEAPGARVVVAGSAAEYGRPASAAPVREGAAAAPLTPYGSSKLCQTLAALAYASRGMDVVAARLFNLAGPGTPEDLAPGAFAAQIARIEAGMQPPVLKVGDLRPRRDYLDVRDAARALVRLGTHGRSGEVYNVASGRAVAMSEVLRRLLAASERDIRVESEAARRRPLEVSSIAGDGRKLLAATSWRQSVSLERSLRDTLAWHRARPHGDDDR